MESTVAGRSGDSPAGSCRPYRCHLLVEVANFVELRRRLGCAGADRIADALAHIARDVMPSATVTVVGAGQVGCSFDDRAPDAIGICSAAIDRACVRGLSIDGESVAISLSFGGAATCASPFDEVALVEEAEAALAAARAGRVIPHPAAIRSGIEASELARELDAAIERDELVLHYQPKVHVRRQEITSAEALIRWQHPTRGLVMPNDFIPVAEQYQLIDRMTLWAIRKTMADQRHLSSKGHELRLFINISGQSLADAAFVREACSLIADADACLGFEVTETSVIRDPASAIANLQTFADFGITIAIDDYGAGLSSLAYLKQLPARELKIDKLFVTQLTSSHRDPLIVRSTIDLAHALEMEVVAEGVETNAALALLTVMGCDMVQGYLISRPVVLDALVQYLDDGRHRLPASDPLASFGTFGTTRKTA
ncbi:EAL domain-containing protein [Sphingomonas sp. A2-49]|uniref:EAL domain-containing protein n=1 Tax=Sphingomonas sp. A2-49 TaxID=1391375 RepID=UPI0021CFFE90|nr:EAL domain-containing protein [Sphingomonas sp. A2-49]MCU6453528.1 EAL domain-containing protein [Sphingomonas sp. A2-49]